MEEDQKSMVDETLGKSVSKRRKWSKLQNATECPSQIWPSSLHWVKQDDDS